MMHFYAFLTSPLLAMPAAGHPGHDAEQEMIKYRDFPLNNRNNLRHCAEEIRAQGLDTRNIEREPGLLVG